MTRTKWVLGLAALTAVAVGAAKPELWDLLPSRTAAGKQASGAWLVATNQLIRPWNTGMAIAGRPADFALNEGATLAAVLNGTSIVIVDGTAGKELARTASRTTSYLGIAFRPGTSEIWASEATRSGPDSLLIVSYTPDGRISGTSRMNLAAIQSPPGWPSRRTATPVCRDAPRQRNRRDRGRNPSDQARHRSGLAPFAVVLDETAGGCTCRTARGSEGKAR